MTFFEQNKYPVTFALIGLIIILPILTLGFLKTLILFGFVALSAFVGHYFFRDSGLIESIQSKLRL